MADGRWHLKNVKRCQKHVLYPDLSSCLNLGPCLMQPLCRIRSSLSHSHIQTTRHYAGPKWEELLTSIQEVEVEVEGEVELVGLFTAMPTVSRC